jgi:signal transduction histidine kinase
MSADDHTHGLPSDTDGLAFFGALTASISHELNNVISIIDQTAGLLDDMIKGEEHGIPINIERLGTAVASIGKQTSRGLTIIRRMNKFAHSADHPTTEYDVRAMMRNLVELSRRLADMKRVDLVCEPAEDELLITGNPFAVQQALFGVIKLILEQAESGARVECGVQTSDPDVNLVMTVSMTMSVDASRLDGIRRTAELHRGRLSIREGEGVTEFRLTIAGAASASTEEK